MRIRCVCLAVLATLVAQCRTPAEPPASIPKAPVIPVEQLSKAAAESGLPVEVLQEETRYRFHSDGTKTVVQRVTFRILNLRNLGDWARMSATYRPWFEVRPQLLATVTTPDGERFSLDQKSVAEAPVPRDDELLSDARQVLAPLPALVAGAVVEQTVIKKEKQPFFSEGTAGRFYFGMGVPVYVSRLVLEVPGDIEMRHEVRGVSIQPTVEKTKKGQTLTFETGPLLPQTSPVVFLPADVPRYPHVAFTTVPKWRRVARRYAQLVEKQISDFDAKSLVKDIDRKRSRA
ncbi:MAG: DUF3857 domain-containing protein, partial [Myxococcota bacterium]